MKDMRGPCHTIIRQSQTDNAIDGHDPMNYGTKAHDTIKGIDPMEGQETITPFDRETLLQLLERREVTPLRTLLAAQPVPDIVEVLQHIPIASRTLLFRLLPHKIAVEVFP